MSHQSGKQLRQDLALMLALSQGKSVVEMKPNELYRVTWEDGQLVRTLIPRDETMVPISVIHDQFAARAFAQEQQDQAEFMAKFGHLLERRTPFPKAKG